MECKDKKCSNAVSGKALFCSDTCRKRTSRTSNSDTDNSDSEVGQVLDLSQLSLDPKEVNETLQVINEIREESRKPTRPPCTPDQLTSSCCACVDNEGCSYLHNMNSAVPGDADYAGVI